MPVLPFGEYRPDVSDYKGQYSQTILNVVPRGDGYGPFQALSAVTAALPSACRGLFFARKNDGSISVFAGTSTRLYNLNNTTMAWTDVSLGGLAYTAVSSNAQWQFAQFNNFVVAVQQNVAPQVFDLTSSTAFAALGGSPPFAAYVSVVNRFLVLSGIASPNVYRVQWSDLNNISNWSSGQADSQDLADGGIVRGVAGGEYGVIFQDASIRRMTFSPGSPYVFGIDRISSDDGLFGAYSLVQAGDRIFFVSPQGFKMILPGLYPQPIGRERIDKTFFSTLDADSPQLLIGAHDPKAQRVFFAYKSLSGAAGLFDTILCYDWVLDRWTKVSTSGQFISSLARPGMTLEQVDAAFGADIDTLTLSSLDDISASALASLAGADSSGAAGFFTGDTLEATMITP
ncbi:MAG: hypothetical protein KGL39_56220, partial [Patescibacteria group bacterium]|nr:hypothetical protein [Patescibacteria group bacterium]